MPGTLVCDIHGTLLDYDRINKIVILGTALDYRGLLWTIVDKIDEKNSDQRMEIQRKCQWCGKPFIAHTMVTKYCCKSCIDAAYKDRRNKRKLEEYVKTEEQQPLASVGVIGDKAFLTPNECAVLLGVCRSTIYNMLACGQLRALQMRRRKTLIRRSDIEKLFDEAPAYKKRKTKKNEAVLYYTTKEIQKKFKIEKKTLYRRCKLYDIPKIEEGNRVYYNRALIDKYFTELIEEINPDIYYTTAEVMEKYGMSRASVASFALRHNIPRINRHHDVYYSRAHMDAIKEKQTKLDPDYYTYEEIKTKYGITTINISYYVNKYDIERYKQGSRTMVKRTDFDRVYREHRDGTYQPKKREKEPTEPKVMIAPPDGYLSAEDIAVQYTMTKTNVWKLCRENNIHNVTHDGLYYYEQLSVEKLFDQYKTKEGVTEWISAEQMEQQYNMTADARRSFAYRHHIPTRSVYGRIQYSRDHIEQVKKGGFDQRENYYSVQEAMERFSLSRDSVYNYAKYNKVRKTHYQRQMYLFKEDFDRIMLERLHRKPNDHN